MVDRTVWIGMCMYLFMLRIGILYESLLSSLNPEPEHLIAYLENLGDDKINNGVDKRFPNTNVSLQILSVHYI